MATPIDPEQLLTHIRGLPLKEALAAVIGGGVTSFVGKGYDKVKQALVDKYNAERYYFVPNKNEADRLKSLETNVDYVQLKGLVPNYKYIDLVRAGLLLRGYMNGGSDVDKERVRQIKENIIRRPNGRKLLKIMNFPTTPFFNIVLSHLFDLKAKNYSIDHIEEILDEMVSNWESASFFVRTEDDIASITDFCHRKLDEGADAFFVLGMGPGLVRKIETAARAFTDLKRSQAAGIEKREVRSSSEEGIPRIEVTFYRRAF